MELGRSLYEAEPWEDVTGEHLDDPGPNLLIYGGCVLWVLGHEAEARSTVADAVALAHKRGHRLSLTHTVYMAGHLSELIGDWESVRQSNEETAALALEWGLTGLRQQVARRDRLVAVALNCDRREMVYKRRNPQPGFARSLHEAVLAQAYGRVGKPRIGIRLIDRALQWSAETGSRFYDAELHRIQAELFLKADEPRTRGPGVPRCH